MTLAMDKTKKIIRKNNKRKEKKMYEVVDEVENLTDFLMDDETDLSECVEMIIKTGERLKEMKGKL